MSTELEIDAFDINVANQKMMIKKPGLDFQSPYGVKQHAVNFML